MRADGRDYAKDLPLALDLFRNEKANEDCFFNFGA